jgi:hypothetical protein
VDRGIQVHKSQAWYSCEAPSWVGAFGIVRTGLQLFTMYGNSILKVQQWTEMISICLRDLSVSFRSLMTESHVVSALGHVTIHRCVVHIIGNNIVAAAELGPIATIFITNKKIGRNPRYCICIKHYSELRRGCHSRTAFTVGA